MKYSFHSLKTLAAVGGEAGCRELWHHGVTFLGRPCSRTLKGQREGDAGSSGGGSVLAAESGWHQASHFLLQLGEKHGELLRLLGRGRASQPAARSHFLKRGRERPWL